MKLGIDINTGGTYTDAVIYDFEGRKILGSAKSLTTKNDLTIGIANRYTDIVTCWGSLKNNFSGVFGGKVYPDFDPDLLYEKLGIPLDREKLRWCRLIEKALS